MIQSCRVYLILSLLFYSMLACDIEHARRPDFDSEKAFGYIVKQVSFGPRVPGSEASIACRNYFYEFFTDANLIVDSQSFLYDDPYSNSKIRMVNVIASYRNPAYKNEPAMLLMAHYDSRPRAELAFNKALIDTPIDGANDGGSGVAVLMEIGRLLDEFPPPGNIDLVLVDGEDWGKTGDVQNYLIGSREFARQNIRDKYSFGIIIDMVGDSLQQFYREVVSDQYAPDVNDMIFNTAKKLNLDVFHDSLKYKVYDDHVPLNAAGLPSAVIIDLDYPYWHTEFDKPEKCSAESLGKIGKLLIEIIYDKSLWLKK